MFVKPYFKVAIIALNMLFNSEKMTNLFRNYSLHFLKHLKHRQNFSKSISNLFMTCREMTFFAMPVVYFNVFHAEKFLTDLVNLTAF